MDVGHEGYRRSVGWYWSLPPGKDKSYTLSPEEVARRNADASACNEQVGESSPTPLLTDCMKAKGWNYVIVEVLVR